MDFNISGLVAIIVFYVLILLVGIWAARKGKKEPGGESEDIMLAGRSIGAMVGCFTMTATWVGGGYINGTAEMIYRDGLIWCQAPVGYALSLILGGVLFAGKMREKGYVTMLDPFQHKYGERMGGFLFLPALMGEIFWSAAILAALGATLTVILNIDDNVSVIVSACIAVFYTFFGGLYSVAYTDVVQLFCIFIGLWICIPAAMVSPLTGDITKNFITPEGGWVGKFGDSADFMLWLDSFLLLTFGGIPWQVYFQRVLSSKNAKSAAVLSYVAALGCIVMAIPPVLIGAVARTADWNSTGWKPGGVHQTDIPADYHKLVLPLVLQYLTPPWIAFIGLGAVSAAVMSSADSSILSAAAMFAHNIWKLAIRPGASEVEIIRVLRFGVVMVGVAATVMALLIKSIYELWFLCADLVYVILFPQLLCVVYLEKVNTYGAAAAYIVGIVMRIMGGEPAFGIWPLIKYYGYTTWDTKDGPTFLQKFPFRTLSMLCTLFSLVSISYLADFLFTRGVLPQHYDFWECVINIPHDRLNLKESASMAASSETLALGRIQQENGAATNPAFLHPGQYSVRRDPPTSVSTTPLIDPPSPKTSLEERLPLDPSHAALHYESMLKD